MRSIVDLYCGRFGGRYDLRIFIIGEFLALIKDFIIFVVRKSRLSSTGFTRASYRMLSIGVVLNAPRAVLKAVFIVDFTDCLRMCESTCICY